MATNTTNFNLSKPAYTDTADIAVVNSNMDKVDTSLQGLGTGLAIISNANTHVAITSGQYVYVHGHGSLAEGLYMAKSNISADATLSTSNLQAVSGGGLNALIGNMSSNQKNLALQDWEGKAPRSMYTGDFIYWNNVLYRAKQSISSGTTLTSSMLESVQMTNASSLPGALNVINGNFKSVSEWSKITKVENISSTFSINCVKLADYVIVQCHISLTTSSNTDFTIATFANGIRPYYESYANAVATDGSCRIVTLDTSGNLKIYKPEQKHYYFSLVYTV